MMAAATVERIIFLGTLNEKARIFVTAGPSTKLCVGRRVRMVEDVC